VYAPGEGTTKTPSKQAFGKHDLKFGTDAVVVYLTEEILADVNYVEQYVVNSCKGKLSWQRDYNILRGTYSAAVQGFIGVFDAGAANFYVEPVAHANPWTGAIVNAVISGVDPRLRSGSEWYMSNSMHQNLLGDLGAGTTVSTQPMFSNNGMTLAGYPINIMTQQAAFGTAPDILFGNFSQYSICEKTGVIMTVSKDLAFLTDEIVLRFTQRALGAPVFRAYQGLDAVNVAAFSSTSGT
jgi:HK97 family phage major capsid protein